MAEKEKKGKKKEKTFRTAIVVMHFNGASCNLGH